MSINNLTQKSLNAFELNNKKIDQKHKELSGGKKINSVSDNPAGFTITEKLDVRTTSLKRSFDNIGYAKNVLYTAESGYSSINDILGQIREKAIQAGNGSYSDDERSAIRKEISALSESIDDVIKTTKFNNQSLIGTDGLTGSFQVGADSGDDFSVDLSAAVDSASLNLSGVSEADLESANLGSFLESIDSALGEVGSQLQTVGSNINRLGFKEDNLSVAITNTDAAASRIRDVDIAKAQSSLLQAQILQNVQTAQLSQANISANSVNTL